MALTNQQILEYRKKYGIGDQATSSNSGSKNSALETRLKTLRQAAGIDTGTTAQKKTTGQSGLAGVAIGAGKGVASTLTGTSSLGERIITGLGRMFTPKPLEKSLGFEKREKTGAETIVPEEMRTPEGTAEKIGFGLEQLGEFLVPAGTITKIGKGAEATVKALSGSKKLGSLARVGTSALGFGGVSSLQEGEVDKEAVAYAAIIESVAPVVSKLVKPITSAIEKLPSRFVRSAIGRKKADVLKDIKDGTDNLANYVIKNKPIATGNQLLSDSSSAVKTLGEQIKNNLESAVRSTGQQRTIGMNQWFDSVLKTESSQNALLNRADIKNVIEQLVPQSKKFLSKNSLTVVEANRLRQLLDETLGDRGFLTDKLPANKTILREAVTELRNIVKDKAPEGTRKLFQDLASEIRLRDTLLDKLASRSGNEIINLGDLIVGGAFGVGGGGVGGSLLAAGTLRILRSTPFKIFSAKTLQFINSNAKKLEALEPQARATIIRIIDDAFSDDDND